MNYKTYTVAKAKTEIKGIAGARAKLDERIQHAALVCIYHAHLHGDVTLAGELTKAITGGCKVEALRLWMCEFGPITAEAGGVLRFSKTRKLEGAELDSMMEAAAAKLWHDYKTEKPAEEFSLAALVQAVLRKAEKAKEKGGYVPTAEDAAVLEAMAKLPAPVKAAKEAKA